MKTLVGFAMLACIASGCSSASSSGGSLAPGQVDADGPTAIPPPTNAGGPIAAKQPPAPPEPVPGCPSNREPSETVLGDVADVRARLAGIYRECVGGGTGLEIRADPESDTRLLWYTLDNRFVRYAGAGTSGTMDVGACEGAVCSVTWHADGVPEGYDPERELTVWSEPTAITIATNLAGGAWTEYVRIAD